MKDVNCLIDILRTITKASSPREDILLASHCRLLKSSHLVLKQFATSAQARA